MDGVDFPTSNHTHVSRVSYVKGFMDSIQIEVCSELYISIHCYIFSNQMSRIYLAQI